MDPIMRIVMALSLGAAAERQPATEQIITDGYAGLKVLLKRKYPRVNVEQLEEDPHSKNRRGVIEEELVAAGANKDQEVLHRAQELLALIQRRVPDTAAAIGMELKEIAVDACTMPPVMATAAGPDQAGMPILRPLEAAPGAVPAAAWEPGIVEVEFRDDVAAEVGVEAAGRALIASAAGVDLGSVQAVLLRHNLQRAEPSFHLTAAEAARAQADALTQDPEAPNPRNFVTFHFPEDADVQAIAQELRLLPEIERAMPVPQALPPQTVTTAETPLHEPLVGTGDQVVVNPITGLENQWYLFRCRVHDAWTQATGTGVVVADIDWGYRVTHQDLVPGLDLSHAHNAYDGGASVSHGDSTSHGTAVLGIAGAAHNDRGMAGVAPMATLWPIQANSGPGQRLPGNAWANAIDWVRRADSGGHRKIIILEVQTGTLGNYEQVPSVHAAIRLAIASGVVVCVAAGNGDRHAGIDDQGNPFPETGSILVGATAYDPHVNRRAWFSNYGPPIVVSAPGDSAHDVTCSIQADNAYQNPFGGTSGATPKVAGTAALMLEVNPRLTHGEIREILRSSGDPIESEVGKPVGRFLNAGAAVREAASRRDVPSPHMRSRPAVAWSRERSEPIKDAVRKDPAAAQTLLLNSAVDLSTFLASLPPAWTLTKEERLLLIDQALLLLEDFFVHRPLKEAMYAVRPVQRLRLLRHRVEQTLPDQLESDLRFHNEMTQIFMSLRDLHTNYLLPSAYRGKIAFLPFLIETYDEGGHRRYLVSKLVDGFSHPTFAPGVEITQWNGMPMERAVELNADRQAGSNPDARHARGLEAMTIRPLVVSLPPDAAWEIIAYRTPEGDERELRQNWQVFTAPPGASLIAAASGTGLAETAMGLDIQTEAVRQAKQIFFAPQTLESGRLASVGATGDGLGAPAERHGGAEATAMGLDIQTEAVRQAKQIFFAPQTLEFGQLASVGAVPAVGNESLESQLPGTLKARVVSTTHGTFGYIRIYTFNVQDADAFVQEFVRLAALLPQNGLIIDVRGNGGGLIWAGERLLQVLTPRRIEPERLLFINTPLTLELCRRHAVTLQLSPWEESIRQSVITGASYSRAFPITSEESCNSIGQRYVGPVVLIIDALCYSTTDIFAAGFQDHNIGPILGVSSNTGAGGANVWTHSFLQSLFAGPSSPLRPLPQGSGMRVAIRQTSRVGPQAGTLLEDLGVVPDMRHQMTRNDLLNDNVDLINKAASLLAGQAAYTLVLRHLSRTGNTVSSAARTGNINRLDFYLNGRPQQSLNVSDGEIRFNVTAPTGTTLEVRGFSGDHCVAVQRLPL